MELCHHGVKGQKWGVRNGPPYPLDSIANGNAVRLNNYDGPAYFISEKKLENLTLTPRVPRNFLTKNGYEDSETPRVSFAPSINGCLAGLSQNLDNKEFYVYSPADISKCDVYKPNIKAVPDSEITGELWITNPVKLKQVNRIRITGNKGEDGKEYKYGNNTAILFDDWEYEEIDRELYHHGVKGQKWGVRRWQNPDGSLTEEGKYRQRAMRAAKTKKYVDDIWRAMSPKDQELMGGGNTKEFLSLDEGEYVLKRFLDKSGKTPVAWLDIMTTTKPGHLTVAIGTHPDYRGQGRALKLANKGRDWFDKNADKYNATYLGWGAYARNKASRHVAERAGFEYEPEKSDDTWAVYGHHKVS